MQSVGQRVGSVKVGVGTGVVVGRSAEVVSGIESDDVRENEVVHVSLVEIVTEPERVPVIKSVCVTVFSFVSVTVVVPVWLFVDDDSVVTEPLADDEALRERSLDCVALDESEDETDALSELDTDNVVVRLLLEL